MTRFTVVTYPGYIGVTCDAEKLSARASSNAGEKGLVVMINATFDGVGLCLPDAKARVNVWWRREVDPGFRGASSGLPNLTCA